MRKIEIQKHEPGFHEIRYVARPPHNRLRIEYGFAFGWYSECKNSLHYWKIPDKPEWWPFAGSWDVVKNTQNMILLEETEAPAIDGRRFDPFACHEWDLELAEKSLVGGLYAKTVLASFAKNEKAVLVQYALFRRAVMWKNFSEKCALDECAGFETIRVKFAKNIWLLKMDENFGAALAVVKI